MNAKTETARSGIKWSDGARHEDRRASIGVLGFTAVGLWMLAVFLGIGAPLLGLEIDTRLVVGVLVASGIVSLLSLPLTACPRSGATRTDDRSRPHH